MKASSKLSFVLLSTSLLLSACGGSSSASSSTSESSSDKGSSSSSSEVSSSGSSSSSTESKSSESSSSSALESSSSSSSSSLTPGGYDLSALQAEYGTFSITADATDGASATYDETANTYTLAYCATSPTYTVKGYFDGEILISDVNALGTISASVYLTLDNACLVNEGDTPCVYYSGEKKALKIAALSDTSNYILALGTENNAITSENNAELGAEGALSIFSYGGHGVSASDMRVYGAGTIDVESGKDGFHGSSFVTDNDESTDMVYLTGALNIHDVGGQAIEATTKKVKGTVNIESGAKVTIDNAISIAKTDLSFTNAGSVIATNITGDAFTTDNTGSCVISSTGTLSVNGSSYSDTTI